MKVWTNNEFEGRWPVGSAAVVVADTDEEAADLLNASLRERGLTETACAAQFKRLPTYTRQAVILHDGNY